MVAHCIKENQSFDLESAKLLRLHCEGQLLNGLEEVATISTHCSIKDELLKYLSVTFVLSFV